MQKKVKARLVSLLFVIVVFIGSSTKSHASDESEQIRNVIKNYYDLAYEIKLNLQMQDMSSVLNLRSIQNQNFMIAMEENIYSTKDWFMKAYDGKNEQTKYPIFYDFDSIEINGSSAVAKVHLSGEEMQAYPPFVVFGENTFYLDKVDGVWLINEHYYNDWYLFEGSRTEKLPPINYEELQKTLDKNTGTDIEGLREVMQAYTENQKIIEKYSKPVQTSTINPPYIPHTDYKYSFGRAVEYAKQIAGNDISPFFLQYRLGLYKFCLAMYLLWIW